jgi:hypothetical protein
MGFVLNFKASPPPGPLNFAIGFDLSRSLRVSTRHWMRRTTWEGGTSPGWRRDADMPRLQPRVRFHCRGARILHGERLRNKPGRYKNCKNCKCILEKGKTQQGSPRPGRRPRRQQISEQSPEGCQRSCTKNKERLAWKPRTRPQIAEASKTFPSSVSIE